MVKEVTEEEKRRQKYMEARPSIDTIINLHDFEVSPYFMVYSTSLMSSSECGTYGHPRESLGKHNMSLSPQTTPCLRRHCRRTTHLDRMTRSPYVRIDWRINGELYVPLITARGAHSTHAQRLVSASCAPRCIGSGLVDDDPRAQVLSARVHCE